MTIADFHLMHCIKFAAFHIGGWQARSHYFAYNSIASDSAVSKWRIWNLNARFCVVGCDFGDRVRQADVALCHRYCVLLLHSI